VIADEVVPDREKEDAIGGGDDDDIVRCELEGEHADVVEPASPNGEDRSAKRDRITLDRDHRDTCFPEHDREVALGGSDVDGALDGPRPDDGQHRRPA
jgi:hypothetical protein